VTVEHHYAHCYSYFPLSETEVDLALSIDGLGDNTNVLALDLPTRRVLAKRDLAESLNCTMSWVLNDIGVSNMGWDSHHLDWAGKLMGLQGYGNDMVIRLTRASLMDLPVVTKGREFTRRPQPGHELSSHWPSGQGQELRDFLYSYHKQYTANLVDFMGSLFERDARNYYAGGVALNVVVNDVLREHFPSIVINAHCADENLSFGLVEMARRFSVSA